MITDELNLVKSGKKIFREREREREVKIKVL